MRPSTRLQLLRDPFQRPPRPHQQPLRNTYLLRLPVRLAIALAQGGQKQFSTLVISEDRLSPIPAIHQVIDRPRILDSRLAGLAPTLFQHLSLTICQCLGPTPRRVHAKWKESMRFCGTDPTGHHGPTFQVIPAVSDVLASLFKREHPVRSGQSPYNRLFAHIGGQVADCWRIVSSGFEPL